eukprot:2406144-Pyramimonas_sp.AAC.1
MNNSASITFTITSRPLKHFCGDRNRFDNATFLDKVQVIEEERSLQSAFVMLSGRETCGFLKTPSPTSCSVIFLRRKIMMAFFMSMGRFEV